MQGLPYKRTIKIERKKCLCGTKVEVQPEQVVMLVHPSPPQNAKNKAKKTNATNTTFIFKELEIKL